jgi:hypothetical protein
MTVISSILYKLALLKNRCLAIVRLRHTIFDYLQLAQPIGACYNYHGSHDFNYYGIGHILKKHFDISESSVEHGFVLGSYVQKHLLNYLSIKSLFTFSEYRETFINEKNPSIVVHKIGPYIAYAPPIYSADLLKISKKKLGKVLLVFPVHTLLDTETKYDRKKFVDIIKEKSLLYDTVIVCGYWADILKGNLLNYKECGFKIVCAGHSFDPYFLSRLKYIINLSDTVITNSIGTHIGYSMFLGKHTVVIRQRLDNEALNDTKEFSTRTIEEVNSMREVENQLFKVFEGSEFEIANTEIQKKTVSNLFGFKYVSCKK